MYSLIPIFRFATQSYRSEAETILAEPHIGNVVYPSVFYDVSVRPPVHTDAGRGGRESDVSPSGKGYVIAEVKVCISSN